MNERATGAIAFAPISAQVGDLERLGEGLQAEVFIWPEGGVIKLFRSREGYAQALVEASAMRALEDTDIPAPRILATVSIDERPGIVMERVEGVDQLKRLGRQPWTLASTARTLAGLHARLHSAPAPDGLPSLNASVRGEIERSDRVPAEYKAAALAALDRLPDGGAICHWDFHPGNVIETAAGARVIDWAVARRGEPLADVARSLLILQAGALPPGMPFLLRRLVAFSRGLFGSIYLREYRRLRPFDQGALDAWRLVSAASRLSFDIPGEGPYLLSSLAAMSQA